MNLNEIETEINNIFLDSPYRQIVFWYDETKEFKNQNINEDTLIMLSYLNTENMLD